MYQLIVDGNSLAHRAGSVLFLKSDSGKPTSVSFGVLNMLRSVIEKFDIKEICVTWDYKGSISKKTIYPEYKQHRRQWDDNSYSEYLSIIKQIDDVIGILPYFGIKQLRKEGIEADDIIGLLSKELVKQGQKILVLSSDQDLFQLVEFGIDIYYPLKDLILTRENFESELGLKPEHWIFYRTIKSDSSDNIKGLKGIGEVTAKKLINRFGPWTDWFINKQVKIEILTSVNNSQRMTLQDSSTLPILLRNYQLMSLGFLDENYLQCLLIDFNNQHPMFNEQEIRRYFLENQFDSFLNRNVIHIFREFNRKKDGV